jgi:hypothetical protein
MDAANFSELNWLHILVAAIAYFALGAVWYSALFGKKWVAYHQINMDHPDAKKGTGIIMTASFVLMFLTTIGLALLVNRLGLYQAVSGVKLGLLTGVCFSASAISICYLYVKKPSALHLIDGGYHIVGQIIAATILCVWK